MSNNIFATVKGAVSVPKAARYYGLKVHRGDMICCPFHEDKHPSMKLNEDFFYCFGCGATGDVIDFVAKLFGLSNYEAACKLASDFGLDPNTPTPAAIQPRSIQKSVARAFREEELFCQRVLFDYLHLLEDWKTEYAPKTPDEEWDDHFVEACQMLDTVEYLADLLLFSDLEIRVKLVGQLYRDNTINSMAERLERERKEAAHHEQERD